MHYIPVAPPPPRTTAIFRDFKKSTAMCKDNLRGQKSLGPLQMSLEMAHKVIVPPKKNYVPQFLKQRDINSYNWADLKIETYENFTNHG